MSNGLTEAVATPPTNEELTCYYRGRIDALDLCRVHLNKARLVDNNVIELEIFGGFNGRGTWDVYCDQIKSIINSLRYAWVTSLETDTLDDVWTLKINCKNQYHN